MAKRFNDTEGLSTQAANDLSEKIENNSRSRKANRRKNKRRVAMMH